VKKEKHPSFLVRECELSLLPYENSVFRFLGRRYGIPHLRPTEIPLWERSISEQVVGSSRWDTVFYAENGFVLLTYFYVE
jgi:hypothetical protein